MLLGLEFKQYWVRHHSSLYCKRVIPVLNYRILITNLCIKENHGCSSLHRFHHSNTPWFILPSQLLHPHRHRKHNATTINSLQLKDNNGPILILKYSGGMYWEKLCLRFVTSVTYHFSANHDHCSTGFYMLLHECFLFFLVSISK